MGVAIQSGEKYSWWDHPAGQAGQDWLEDVDLKGKSTWHGPFFAKSMGSTLPLQRVAVSIDHLTLTRSSAEMPRVLERIGPLTAGARSLTSLANVQKLPVAQAIKITVKLHGGQGR